MRKETLFILPYLSPGRETREHGEGREAAIHSLLLSIYLHSEPFAIIGSVQSVGQSINRIPQVWYSQREGYRTLSKQKKQWPITSSQNSNLTLDLHSSSPPFPFPISQPTLRLCPFPSRLFSSLISHLPFHSAFSDTLAPPLLCAGNSRKRRRKEEKRGGEKGSRPLH